MRLFYIMQVTLFIVTHVLRRDTKYHDCNKICLTICPSDYYRLYFMLLFIFYVYVYVIIYIYIFIYVLMRRLWQPRQMSLFSS